jgi:hypothetical protein
VGSPCEHPEDPSKATGAAPAIILSQMRKPIATSTAAARRLHLIGLPLWFGPVRTTTLTQGKFFSTESVVHRALGIEKRATATAPSPQALSVTSGRRVRVRVPLSELVIVGRARHLSVYWASAAIRWTILAAGSVVSLRQPVPAQRLGTLPSPARVAATRSGRVR